ncbi:PIN domain-containing protein [Methanosphaera sp.]|jgi:predicted nucleic acid-binding protein|uniref:type II toxin-antitoxin system VapC family toxin n=1 Tax=Methanosphaera sp. TaxID=2666342 RepID=UPI0025F99B76|nr:PIN domain-containing protein [Methanosphaera sp.]MBE6487051.1 type II toxin-antitoxin system VapC family toxin [Methanosphaera stadtmanae]MEE1117261.1 PIN domain-containing protein [Methanosphaera sp.]
MTKYFLDTNFIIGLILSNDDLHMKSVELNDKYDLENQDCYVSNHVLDEIITIIGQYEGSNLAYNTYLMIKDNFTILNECNIPTFNSKVMTTYLEKNINDKQKVGFTDSSIIEIIKYYHLDKLVTFDKKLAKNSPVSVISV